MTHVRRDQRHPSVYARTRRSPYPQSRDGFRSITASCEPANILAPISAIKHSTVHTRCEHVSWNRNWNWNHTPRNMPKAETPSTPVRRCLTVLGTRSQSLILDAIEPPRLHASTPPPQHHIPEFLDSTLPWHRPGRGGRPVRAHQRRASPRRVSAAAACFSFWCLGRRANSDASRRPELNSSCETRLHGASP
jgi:hypothetical protein